ncbi:hypothetical protein [uncultured Celeribacter sp.]|uniref:hypothetical protein n=1 Tax=uncultured Celeribacter sp. TaxID=1303376 RepID=UPI002AA7E6B0|nr:hypothetical protein [uncultured Celeribacter sp.]
MPLLKINTDGSFLPAGTSLVLREALAKTPAGAPIVICVHGYKFSPLVPEHDPHDHILSLDPGLPCRKALSWPRGLGFGTGRSDEGLCIALGWQARGSIWQAYSEARATGEALARLIWKLDRPVHVMGHSLGARVILSALPHLPEGAVRRAILLSAAEFRSTAEHALDSAAGRTAEVLNVTSRENDLFDALFEMALVPDHAPSRSLGAGLGQLHRGWCDIQIDDTATRAALARLGYDIPAADKKICHWSPYLRAGVFEFYRTALRHPERLPMGLLQEALPATSAPRFSHLLPRRPFASPLSFSRKASS